MEIKIERKIDTTEIKEKLKGAFTESMKDRTHIYVQKEDINDVIDVLEYLENMDVKEQEESQKKEKCRRKFSVTSFPCMMCEKYDECKHVYDILNKTLEESRINQNRSVIEGCNGMEE